jgi:hypothetical protein
VAQDEDLVWRNTRGLPQQVRCGQGVFHGLLFDREALGGIEEGAAVHFGSFFVTQNRDAAGCQPPSQVAEGLVGADGLVPVIRAGTVNQNYSRMGPLSCGQGQGPGKLPLAALNRHILLLETCCVGIGGRAVFLFGARGDEPEPGDPSFRIKHDLDIQHGFFKAAGEENAGKTSGRFQACTHQLLEAARLPGDGSPDLFQPVGRHLLLHDGIEILDRRDEFGPGYQPEKLPGLGFEPLFRACGGGEAQTECGSC